MGRQDVFGGSYMVMLDVKGDQINVGDVVAVAFRWVDIPTLRVGTVQMILDDERRLLVEWHAGKSLPDSKTTKIDYTAHKIAKL